MQNTSKRWIAFFPGQGSQHVGMGKELCENFKIAREVFEEASDATHVDLRKLCFEGPESDLTATENTQPCLLTTSTAAFRVAEAELGLRPDAVAGHSLGEYSALVAARALTLGAAVRWVKARGAAMQTAVPAGQGTMAAILGLEDSVIATLCEAATTEASALRATGAPSDVEVDCIVQPANFNSPGQTVIAGSRDAIEVAVRLTKSGDSRFKGGKAMPLAVSAPFHCALMRPAREAMATIFSQLSGSDRPATPVVPYFPNRTGRLHSETGAILELLIEQIDHPVLWRQTVENALQGGFTHGVEFGPGKVLQGLAKRTSWASSTGPITLNTTGISDAATLKNLEIWMKG